MSVRGREPPALSLTYDLETRTRGDALTAAGVNVNVTLLFAVERYEQVMEAYVRGLERRSATGGPYVEQLIAPDVINTMPEATLRAFADHGVVGPALGVDAGAAEETSAPPRMRASTFEPLPPISSAKACAPSATPTTSCWRASTRSSQRSKR